MLFNFQTVWPVFNLTTFAFAFFIYFSLFCLMSDVFLSGRCYKVTSSKSLGQALESLAQKVQCGVVMNFEKIGGASNLPPPPPEGTVEQESSNS